jgi:alkylation response protein AidB-like acyl-CoA dehydrogenase
MSSADRIHHVSEAEARRVAEAAREKEWGGVNFVRDLFLGRFDVQALYPYPDPERFISDESREWIERFRIFLRDEVDSDRIDREGKVPPAVVERLKEIGAFGMKVPKEYSRSKSTCPVSRRAPSRRSLSPRTTWVPIPRGSAPRPLRPRTARRSS